MTTPIKESTRPVVESEQVLNDNGGDGLSACDNTSALYAPGTEITLLSGLLSDANSSTALHSPATEEPFSASYLLQEQDGVLAEHAPVAG